MTIESSTAKPTRISLGRITGILRRAFWILVPVAALLLILWVRVWSPVSVQSVKVERGTVIQEGFGRGTIESQRKAAVGFDLVGRISEVLVEEGSHVTLGQELARLETNQAVADLRVAQTSVSAARSSLLRLAAEEERIRSLLKTAEREATRMQALFDAGAIASLQRDEAADRLRLARADLDRVLAQRSEATRGIDVAAGGAEQRRVTMVRATLLAPFDGLVTRRLREPGDTVTVGSTVLRIVDTSRVYVAAAVDETVLPYLALDQHSSILFPGPVVPSAPLFTGKVTRIAWEADRQTHEFVVEVSADKLDRRVAIGQRADVKIELSRKESVVRVPIYLVRHDDGGAYVYVDRNGKIASVRPRFGITGDSYVEVIEGLVDGDTLLSSPTSAMPLPIGRKWVRR